jgi:hypothetical protein
MVISLIDIQKLILQVTCRHVQLKYVVYRGEVRLRMIRCTYMYYETHLTPLGSRYINFSPSIIRHYRVRYSMMFCMIEYIFDKVCGFFFQIPLREELFLAHQKGTAKGCPFANPVLLYFNMLSLENKVFIMQKWHSFQCLTVLSRQLYRHISGKLLEIWQFFWKSGWSTENFELDRTYCVISTQCQI